MIPLFALLLAAAPNGGAHIKPTSDVTPVRPLPPATLMPPPSIDVANVMAPVKALLAAYAAQDAAAARAVILPEGGGVTAIVDQSDGTTSVKHLDWAGYLAGMKPGAGDRAEQRLTDPVVESDGAVAMLWSPYVVYANGKAQHCGNEAVDLIHRPGGWKIVNVTFSQRTSGCVE